MPAEVEKCVKEMSGVNKRTGKPFTDSEKWAICTASHKRKMEGKSEVSTDEIAEQVSRATHNYAQKVFNSGRANSVAEGYQLAQVSLARHGYDYLVLEMIVGG